MKIENKKIVCVHLLNDFSGSPRVLSQVVNVFLKQGLEVDIYTSGNKEQGFLSNIEGATTKSIFYRWSPFKVVTLGLFLLSQIVLFFKLLRYHKQDVVFYVNTILPFGAALAGKVLNKQVIYHVHETSVKPAIFKWFLFYLAKKTASDAIYVSQFLIDQEPLPGVKCHVVYNTLSKDFITKSQASLAPEKDDFRVLMLSSLKAYKGVNEYVALADALKNIEFDLVLNAPQSDIDHYFRSTPLPKNLKIYPSQQDVHPFYQQANLVLNLSHPEQWVETFGLTALEAMSYGKPVIVPPVGGIAELVGENNGGFKIDVRETEELERTIVKLMEDRQHYSSLAQQARERAKRFDPSKMASQLLHILHLQHSSL